MTGKVGFAGWGLLLAAMMATSSAPGLAQQADYEAIVRMTRECAKIADVPARVACYDNTVSAERLIAGDAPPQRQRAEAPPRASQAAEAQRAPSPSPAQAAAPAAPPLGGFGAETLPVPPAVRKEEESEIELGVRRADSVEPGIYLLTLEDGSQWRFVDAMPQTYEAPRAGSRIALERAALGSFKMSFADQRAVRIRRVQ